VVIIPVLYGYFIEQVKCVEKMVKAKGINGKLKGELDRGVLWIERKRFHGLGLAQKEEGRNAIYLLSKVYLGKEGILFTY
jgi:hypothetical protein